MASHLLPLKESVLFYFVHLLINRFLFLLCTMKSFYCCNVVPAGLN